MEIVREGALGSLERMTHHDAVGERKSEVELGEGEHRDHRGEADHLEDSLFMRSRPSEHT